MSEGAPTILVVDDVPQNVRLLEAVLRPRGYDVLTANDGHSALELDGTGARSDVGRVTALCGNAPSGIRTRATALKGP